MRVTFCIFIRSKLPNLITFRRIKHILINIPIVSCRLLCRGTTLCLMLRCESRKSNCEELLCSNINLTYKMQKKKKKMMPLPGGQPISLRMCIGTTSTANVTLSRVHQTANTQGRLGTNKIQIKYILKRKTI